MTQRADFFCTQRGANVKVRKIDFKWRVWSSFNPLYSLRKANKLCFWSTLYQRNRPSILSLFAEQLPSESAFEKYDLLSGEVWTILQNWTSGILACTCTHSLSLSPFSFSRSHTNMPGHTTENNSTWERLEERLHHSISNSSLWLFVKVSRHLGSTFSRLCWWLLVWTNTSTSYLFCSSTRAAAGSRRKNSSLRGRQDTQLSRP